MPPQCTVPSLGFSVPLALTLGAALALVVAVVGRRPHPRSPAWRVASRPFWVDLALVASVAGIVTLTLNPKSVHNGVQLVPFREVIHAFETPVDWSTLLATVANVVLFMPLGAALNMRRLTLGKTALLALALTICVEGAQLLFVSGRTTSVDDVVLNTLGAVLGHALLLGWSRLERDPNQIDRV